MKKVTLFWVLVAAVLFAVPAQAFQWNWSEHETPSFFDQKTNLRSAIISSRIASEKAKMMGAKGTVSHRAVPYTGDIITEIPGTAEVKYYTRSGFYHDRNYSYAETEQSGMTMIAFDGNDVYLQNPIAGYDNNVWIKGTKDGTTITFPLKQFLMYNTSEGYGFYTTMATISGTERTNDTSAEAITYTISEDGKTITQNGTSATYALTVAWSDDDTVYSYNSPGGEYLTVFTLDEGYVPPSTDLVVLPAGAKVEEWYAEGAGSVAVPANMNVAFVGSDVYVCGLFADFPDAWIKGTINGSTATFASRQYIGDYEAYNIWVIGADKENLTENFTMTYDATAKTLVLDPDQYILANAKIDEWYYLAYYTDLAIKKDAPVAFTIDELPYINDFNTAEKQDEFKIINANGDNVEWSWYSNMARIAWAAPNDDWLTSPLIKLVAGKKYALSFQSHCQQAQQATYPETIEVKVAKEQTAEALAAGLELMPETQVTKTQFQEFGNNGFTVAETGYYCIGIHNISNDMYYCYVDDFSVQEVFTASFDNTASWESVYAYSWTGEDAEKVEELGAWPGTQLTKNELTGLYDVTFIGKTPAKIIFNNGNGGEGNQTADFEFVSGVTYSYEGPSMETFTATFTTDAAWEQVYAYVWSGSGTNKALGEWPGTQLTKNELTGLYDVTINAIAAPDKIIFNNGNGAQTPDLEFENGKAYDYIVPATDIEVNVTDGDIFAAVEAKKAEVDKVGKITINLAKDVTYTISATIEAPAGIVVNGNDAIIDASALEGNMFQWVNIAEPTEWTKADVRIAGVKITGLKKALFYSNSKNYIANDFEIDWVNVEQAGDAVTFDFTKGSTAENFTISNSTFYAPTATTKSFYSSQSGQKTVEWKSDATQTFRFYNNTMYNLAPTKNFFTHRQNNQTWLAYVVENNLFVNCGKSGQVIRGMNGGQGGKNPTWIISGNAFNFDNAETGVREDTSTAESTGDDTEGEGVQNSVAGTVVFAEEAAGNFNGDFLLAKGADVPGSLGAAMWTLTFFQQYTVTFTSDGTWEHVYAYAWTTKDDVTTEFLGKWPGTEMTALDGIDNGYGITFKATAAPEKIIFNNGAGEQTADLDFVDGKNYDKALEDAKAALQAAIDKVKGYNLLGLADAIATAEAAVGAEDATIESLQAAAATFEASVKAYLKANLETAIPMVESLNVEALAVTINHAKDVLANEDATSEELAGALFGLLEAARPYIVGVLSQTIEVCKILGIDTSAAEALITQTDPEATTTELASALLTLTQTAIPAVQGVVKNLKDYMTAFSSEAAQALAEDFAKLEEDIANGNIVAVKNDIALLMANGKPYLQADIEKLEGYAMIIGNEAIINDVAAMKAAINEGSFAGLLGAVKQFEADFLAVAPDFVAQIKIVAAAYKEAGKTEGIDELEAAITTAEQALGDEDKTIVTVGLAVRNLILAFQTYTEGYATYTVAGTKDLTGTENDWDIVEANNMTKNSESGLYEWTAENITVSSENQPQFKVIKTDIDGNQTWYPTGDNWIITLGALGEGATEGLYNITITFNAATKIIAVAGERTGDLPVPAEDITVKLEEACDIAAAVNAAMEGKNVGSVTIELTKGVAYTFESTVTVPGALTVWGNDAVIDASALEGNMFQWVNIAEPTEWTKADVEIAGVKITGLKKALFYSNGKNYVAENFTVNWVDVQLAADATTFDFTKGSTAVNFNVTNSTFYAPTATTKSFYSSQGGQKTTEWDGSATQTFKFHHNTMYNLAPGKNFFSHRQSNQTWLAYDVQENIFVNCGKSGQVIKGMNGGQNGKNPTWIVSGNAFNFDNAETSVREDTSTAESTGDEDEPVQASVAGIVTFTDAANGDFNGTFDLAEGATAPEALGAPKWTITFVEYVEPKLYIMGNGTTGGWNTTTEMTFNETTQTFEYDITATGDTYFTFGDAEFTNWDEWNANNRLAIAAGDQPVEMGAEYQLIKVNGTIKVTATGTLHVSVTQDLKMTITLTTGIDGVNVAVLKDAQIYNLKGQRLDKTQKGLNIINGRKVVIK